MVTDICGNTDTNNKLYLFTFRYSVWTKEWFIWR